MKILKGLLNIKGKNISSQERVKKYLPARTSPAQVLAPEGEFISVFNPRVAKWVVKKFDRALFNEIKTTLAPSLNIELNQKGFPPAAARAIEGQKDETNYDAIWVRDSLWVYHSLLVDPQKRGEAKKLLLSLWDYYSTPAQVQRFTNVISDPGLAQDQMAMPHIRFDGSSDQLEDVMAGGKPEVWNHRQIDAHGIFFAAIGEAFEHGVLSSSDLTCERFQVLSKYPLFLTKIDFSNYEDAGAWEELPRKNSSSIGLATRSLQIWEKLIYQNQDPKLDDLRHSFKLLIKENEAIYQSWRKEELASLIQKGLDRVKRQIKLGGESPDYDPQDLHFRRSDAALLFLIVPSPLEGLNEEERRTVLLMVDALRRPRGVLRYNLDSYQSGNYWIKEPAKDEEGKPTLTGDASSQEAFLWRLNKAIPDTEAEWFFDSLLSLARLRMAQISNDPQLQRQDFHYAAIYLKRALGQITGDTITADGLRVRPWQLPESINTVVIDGNMHYLPSPITPLNWAKASMQMALNEYEKNIL